MFDPNLFQERYRIPSIRLPGWDYGSPGAYFITICTRNRTHWFGEINDETMTLSNIGRIADACWREIPTHFPHVTLDEHVVMPNHVHGIIIIGETETGAMPVPTPVETCESHVSTDERRIPRPASGSLGSIINQYKSICTKLIRYSGSPDFTWQPRYYDCVIRNRQSMIDIRRYIQNNPAAWRRDRNNR